MTMSDHSFASITKLKSHPMNIFKEADTNNAVYILNRDSPVGVVMSLKDYESLVEKDSEAHD